MEVLWERKSNSTEIREGHRVGDKCRHVDLIGMEVPESTATDSIVQTPVNSKET